MADTGSTAVTAIAVVVGVLAVSALAYFVMRPKPGTSVLDSRQTDVNNYQREPTGTGGGTGKAVETNKWDFLTGLTSAVGGVVNALVTNTSPAGMTVTKQTSSDKTVVI